MKRYGTKWIVVVVSIPSSSGQYFRRIWLGEPNDVGVDKKFQSLLHQGSTSDRNPRRLLLEIRIKVSIPSSSGQYFRQGRGGFGRGVEGRFQSLLHQGSTSDSVEEGGSQASLIRSFNPFFIRAVLQTEPNVSLRSLAYPRFNPFFIRAVLQTFRFFFWRRTANAAEVSIPSSSGQYFRQEILMSLKESKQYMSFNPFFIRAVLQTIGLSRMMTDSNSFNPFFIRAVLQTRVNARRRLPRRQVVSIPSSSGQYFRRYCKQLNRLPKTASFNPFFIRAVLQTANQSERALQPYAGTVSIPSSSGQYFRPRSIPEDAWREFLAFQSLLHQGSTSDMENQELFDAIVKRFQSLLHQGSTSDNADMVEGE